jgi:anti-anti-sigma factor
MNIEVQQHGSVSVVAPRGPLVAEDAQAFRAKISEVNAKRRGRIVIDLRDVPLLDSQGIEALADLCHSGGSLAHPRLAGLSDVCREALDLTDVLPRLDVFDTVESAIRSLKE